MFICVALFRLLLFLIAGTPCLLGPPHLPHPDLFSFSSLFSIFLSASPHIPSQPCVFTGDVTSCRLSSPPLRLSQPSLGGGNINSLPVLGGREVLWNGSHTLKARGLKYFREPEAGGSGRHEQMKLGPREALAPTWRVFPSLLLFDVVWFCVLGLVQFYNHATIDIWGHIVLFTYFCRSVARVLCIVGGLHHFWLLSTRYQDIS